MEWLGKDREGGGSRGERRKRHEEEPPQLREEAVETKKDSRHWEQGRRARKRMPRV